MLIAQATIISPKQRLSESFHKKLKILDSILEATNVGMVKRDKKSFGMEARVDFSRINLPPLDKSEAFQDSRRKAIFSITSSHTLYDLKLPPTVIPDKTKAKYQFYNPKSKLNGQYPESPRPGTTRF